MPGLFYEEKMQYESVEFKKHRCFANDWAGFTALKPISVIIGRNNTGKSQLLELVRLCCDKKMPQGLSFKFSGVLEEQDLRSVFPQGHSEGGLRGDHWRAHGSKFLGKRCRWHAISNASPSEIEVDGYDSLIEEYVRRLSGALAKLAAPFAEKKFRHLLADRDIRTEISSGGLGLGSDGVGATNIIRRFIVSSSPELPRDLVQKELLDALNKIFASDGEFTELQVQQHDDEKGEGQRDHWEVYLGEKGKGLVALSRSGSGLKTTILVLLNLLVVPKIEKASPSDYIFAFEELENNLHPALLRRLLRFIESYVLKHGAKVFLTTHSGVALDHFGASSDAQIIHVRHDGISASTHTVAAHLDRLGVISELGAKPSELLQANGIVWVEGPSDCVYLNAWISYASDGELKEGSDYLCAFYGGALLARTQFASNEAADDELVNLLHVNPNVIVVCDSDKDAAGKHLKPRVRRIRDEIEKIPGALIWVTECKEIENYLPGEVIGRALELARMPRSPGQYEAFYPAEKRTGNSYLESECDRSAYDKIDLAIAARSFMTLSAMSGRFDWTERMRQVVETIRRWNA